MTNIVPFHFEDHALRAITDHDGQAWFVLADICGMLGLRNPTTAAKPLDQTEKAKIFLGSGSDATIVSLSGLLTLIVRCRDAMKPGTLPYRVRKWITAEVVPSIMRTGQYGTPAPALDLYDPAVLKRLVHDLSGMAVNAGERIAQLEPKAAALDRIADAQGMMCLTDAAKALGVPPRKLSAWMEGAGWIFRRSDGGPYVAHGKALAAHLLEHKGYTVQRPGKPDKWVAQVMVTPKGMARLAELRAGTGG
ncbi:phage antirepressor [Sphingobium sp. KCTC 72723]|uniref:phage antirepressor n=1 Tax=Sphingobium sp. KCTC 72723 TaxID=2733867 RepID=UPI00165D8743|nr:phage antirepressor KilAC domain-containing protein [Sphingobium sp. KCTC 72723]